MLDWLFSGGGTGGTLTFHDVVLSFAMTVAFGLIISITYLLTQRDDRSENLPLTLLVLPTIVSVVILLIGNNIAGAFSLVGIFSLIRFRSTQGNAKEIAYILFCVMAGLAGGMKEYGIGLAMTILLCLVVIAAKCLRFGERGLDARVKILVPEDKDLDDLFEPVLKKYTVKYRLNRVGTKDFGSVFEVSYDVRLRDSKVKKQLLDELRVLNGNLNVSYSLGTNKNEF